MPNQHKDALLIQAVFALSQGCGTARIDADASEWFRQRYHPWIDKQKSSKLKSPQEVWDTEGPGFLGRFKEIGRQASKGGVVSMASLEAAAKSVESTSECPFCPST